MIKKITSVKNNLIKNIHLLQSKSRERRKQNMIVIEGKKEVSLAIESGINVKSVLFCPEIISYDDAIKVVKSDNAEFIELRKDVYAKLTYRESTGGIIVVAEYPQNKLSNIKVGTHSLFVVLESVEKPGNLGAIARVADGAGVSGIILVNPLTDIYNPNAIRSSLGCVFTTDVVEVDYEELYTWLKENKIISYAAELEASELYHKTNLDGKIALVFGTEATGLSKEMINACDYRIKIPMLGHIDSLNVSTSVAVLVYDAMRQRNFLV